MSVKKFIASTAREALRDIRNELGDDAIILSNRQTDEGVEIIALANEDIVQMTATPTAAKQIAGKFSGQKERPAKSAIRSEPVKEILPVSVGTEEILDQIKSMQSMLQQQFSAMSWNDVLQRVPERASLLRRMINTGFSASLARQLVSKMPADKMQGESWIKEVLKCNLRVAGAEDDIIAKGGVYALIGPTGVGKTTTTAKLAARAVVRYGAEKVALLTTDSYRIGAYEQLKIYGKILGVAVHAVKDIDDLRLTLSALENKHLVLIDTVGMGQRDERVANQNEMFDATGVKRLLLLNSTSSGDTLEDVVRMYFSNKIVGCILTKLDEAANVGTVLDVILRHRLVMHYMANGQRVPEDLHPVHLDYLLRRAMKSVVRSTPFSLQELDLPIVMAAEGSPPRGGAGAIKGEVRYAL